MKKNKISFTDEQKDAINKMKNYRLNFIERKKRGCLQYFFGVVGSQYETLKLFEGRNGFCNAMKEAGYSKSYISEIRKYLK